MLDKIVNDHSGNRPPHDKNIDQRKISINIVNLAAKS